MRDEARISPLRLEGKRNFIHIAGILYGVFLPTPWREILMISMVILSLVVTPKGLRQRNNYTWHPIVEVAILFAGIFVTMVPMLELLKGKGASFGISRPWQFFWLTGGLSSFLDNAPTYLTFFSLAQGLHLPGGVVGIPADILKAISVGSVFMGANTYIGNGPNFMVKAIADHAGFKTPSFFGYMLYSMLILMPVFGIFTLIFFV
jgi:Na+/H+ antiporter NhaD/arsenite permease-like protein